MRNDDDYLQLIGDTISKSQELLASGVNAAVAQLDTVSGRRLYVCHNYWDGDDHTTATEFEINMVEEAVEFGPVNQGVIAVPMFLRIEDGDHLWRPFDHGPPRPDETAQLWALSVHLDDGLDLHRCTFQRIGDVVAFGPVETYQGQLNLDAAAPGYALVGMLAAQEVE